MSLLMTLLLVLAALLSWLTHPLSMGLILIMETIVIAVISGLYAKSFMYSYILVITMLSGALVLFIYMSSIASNKKFKTSIIAMLMAVMAMPIIYIMIEKYDDMINHTINSPETSMIKLFNQKTMFITIMLVLYLLFTMITVVNIVNIQEGPLRKKS